MMKEITDFTNEIESFNGDHRIPNKTPFSKKNIDKNKLVYFYQIESGFNIFLDPLDQKYIEKSQNSLPLMINGVIDEFKSISKGLKDLKQD